MKKSIKFMTAAMAVLALASCSNEDFLSVGQKATVANKGEMIYEADPLESGSVSTRAYRNGETNQQVNFVAGDKMRVYDKEMRNFSIYAFDEGSKKFKFEKGNVKEGEESYAVFPADKVYAGYTTDNENTTVEFIIDDVIKYNQDSEMKFGNDVVWYACNIPMFAEVTGTADGGLKAKHLRAACSILRIDLKNAFTNVPYLRLTTQKRLDKKIDEAYKFAGKFQAELKKGDDRFDVALKAAEEDAYIVQSPDLYIDLREVPSSVSVIYVPIVPGLDGDLDDPLLMATEVNAADPKKIKDADWFVANGKFPGKVFETNHLYKIGHEFDLEVMSPNKVSQMLEQYKNSESDIVMDVTKEFLIDGNRKGEKGFEIKLPALKEGIDVTLNLSELETGVSNDGPVDLVIMNADDEAPFEGTFTINVGKKLSGNVGAFNIKDINAPKATIILAGDFSDQPTLQVKGLKETDGVASLYLGDGETTTKFKPESGIFENVVDFAITDKAQYEGDIEFVANTDIPEKNVELVTIEGQLKGSLTTPAEAEAADINIQGTGTLRGDLTVGGVRSNVLVADEGLIYGGFVNMEAVKKGALTITSKGKELGTAGRMVAMQIDNTVTVSCDVNIDMDEEGIAVNKGTLVMMGAGKKVNLGQGYIKTLKVDVQNAGTWEEKKIDLVFGAGNVAIKNIKIEDDNVLTYNSSKWNGETMGEQYVAPEADYRTTSYEDKDKYMFTATQLSVTDAFDKAELSIRNDIDMANFKYAGISETTDPAIIVDGYYYGDDKKLVYADAEAGKKLFTISNLNYEKIGTGLFNKFAGGIIQNLIFKGVKSELNTTKAQEFVGGLVGNATAETQIDYVDVSGIALKARHNIGGLVGKADAQLIVVNSKVAGSIDGGYALGGLVGITSAKFVADATDASGITFSQSYDSGKTMDIKYAQVGGFVGTTTSKPQVLISNATAPTSINYTKKAKMYVSDVTESLGNFYNYTVTQNFIGYCGHKAKGFDNVTIGSTAINGSAYQVPSNFSNTVATGYKALYKWTEK